MRDQILLVAGAEFVAGIDGSAMHLCGFMRRGSTAVVIETRPSTAFAHLNRAVGVRTVLLRVSETQVRNGQPLVIVDIEKLVRGLDFLG